MKRDPSVLISFTEDKIDKYLDDKKWTAAFGESDCIMASRNLETKKNDPITHPFDFDVRDIDLFISLFIEYGACKLGFYGLDDKEAAEVSSRLSQLKEVNIKIKNNPTK